MIRSPGNYKLFELGAFQSHWFEIFYQPIFHRDGTTFLTQKLVYKATAWVSRRACREANIPNVLSLMNRGCPVVLKCCKECFPSLRPHPT